MSGLIAFTGPPDPALLDRMLGRLSHRGERLVGSAQTEVGSIAVCEWPDWRPPGEVATSVFHHHDVDWALSGFVFTAIPETPSLENLSRLRGSFGLACLDQHGLTIARDAQGCQSLFYGRFGNRWLVASEPKAITSEADFVARIRPAAIARYLSFSFSPTYECMLENLYQAQAGCRIKLRHGCEPSSERYFCFEEGEPDDWPYSNWQNEASWIAKTKTSIQQAVADRLTGSPPLVFLSGGLDSSIVAAEVAKQSTDPIRTFAIHFGKGYPNELQYAAAVARHIGSDHEEVLVRPKDFVPRLRQMVWHLDEPIGDPITQPNFELARHVRPEGQFVFNGEGGDPLFGGPKNLQMTLMHWYGGLSRDPNFREQAYLASYRRGYDEHSRLLSEEMRTQIDAHRDLESVLKPFFETSKPSTFLNKLMAINIRLKGANLILPKVDRMLAAHGLTPLSPLFDDRLTRLSFEMPPRLKLSGGIEKVILKRAYQNDLPAEIIQRPKSGMRVPVHHWFKKELRSYAKHLLNRREVARVGVFDPDRVDQLMRYDIDEGAGRYGLRIWMLMTFEIWRRIVVERESV